MTPSQDTESGESEQNVIDKGEEAEQQKNGEDDAQARNEVTLKLHPQPWCGLHWSTTESITNVYNYSNIEEKGKSPMCKVSDIARFNKVRHVYDLLDESGPAHKKLFTVRLVLTETETFEGSGSSIRKAQQAAAEVALKHTTLPRPKEKGVRRKKQNSMASLRILQNVCRAMNYGDPVFITYQTPPPLMQNGCVPMGPIIHEGHQNFNNNGTISSNCIYRVVLKIEGKNVSTGIGPTPQIAKADASANALNIMKHEIQNKSENIIRMIHTHANRDAEGNEEKIEIPKYKQKSVISDVHEKAHQMKLNVVFEVLKEEGPPHDRNYLVRCAFVNINGMVSAEASGSGKKKKEAQQEACSALLKTLQVVENNPVFVANSLCRTQKKLASLHREPKRKTIVKDKKMDPDYGHQINPVSRLIQVLQTKQKPCPTFELVGEHGQSRYKEFVIRVRCENESCEGSGPNKRLAKRAAAENMLKLIGYIKPLPQPGKSLLKKKSIDLDDRTSLSEITEGSQRSTESLNMNEDRKESETTNGEKPEENGDIPLSESPDSGKRRVTFSQNVFACPPPGDENYPMPQVAPLKKDEIVEGKVRRIKRSKDSRRSLTSEQRREVAELANLALAKLSDPEKTADASEEEKVSSVYELEQISAKFKFGVQYSMFPNENANHFMLISLGLENPQVAHGIGPSQKEAEENAALGALKKLVIYGTTDSDEKKADASEPVEQPKPETEQDSNVGEKPGVQETEMKNEEIEREERQEL